MWSYYADVIIGAELPPPPPPPLPPEVYSLFYPSATPATDADVDNVAIELGMRFQTAMDGQVTGVRFYKASTNTGTHTGSLWDATGTKLATVTFSGETSSGWQTAYFATPVDVVADTTYTVSYQAPVGHYSSTTGGFSSTVTSDALRAYTNAGVYRYGSSGGVPTLTYQSTNYFVDVVFASTIEPPPPPPPPELPPLWNASPPAGVSPAPEGPDSGAVGDRAPLASNELWDHFNGATGSVLDSRLWNQAQGKSDGGAEQYQTTRSFHDGNGNAALEAIKSGGTIYSGIFSTRFKFNIQYGWVAARIKFPKTSGTAGLSWFPAFWTLMANWEGYANNGDPYLEIDMMEFFGDSTQYSTHLYVDSTDNSAQSYKPVPGGANAGDDFHTYWMLWQPDSIQIGVDDLIMGTWVAADFQGGVWTQATHQPSYIFLNFAVHPSYLPAPLDSDFPARMLIDWVWYKPLDLL